MLAFAHMALICPLVELSAFLHGQYVSFEDIPFFLWHINTLNNNAKTMYSYTHVLLICLHGGGLCNSSVASSDTYQNTKVLKHELAEVP